MSAALRSRDLGEQGECAIDRVRSWVRKGENHPPRATFARIPSQLNYGGTSLGGLGLRETIGVLASATLSSPNVRSIHRNGRKSTPPGPTDVLRRPLRMALRIAC